MRSRGEAPTRREAQGVGAGEEEAGLIIDEAVRLGAAGVIEYARSNRVPKSRLMAGALDDGDYIAPGDDPNRVLIVRPDYRCVYTEEEQPPQKSGSALDS